MNGPTRIGALTAFAGLASLALVSSASAGVISDPFIRISATNGSGTSTLDIALADTTVDATGTYYNLPAPVTLANGAVISGLFSRVRGQVGTVPNLINLDVTVVAGASDTTFQVNSALFELVPNIFDAARATAGVSLTDSGGVVGARFAGAGPGGGAFYAAHDGAAPGGTAFASLLAGPFVTSGSTGASEATVGYPAYIPIGSAADMSSQWRFVLSAGDQAGVTSGYFIIPSPGAISLIGLAGLFSLRRSRK